MAISQPKIVQFSFCKKDFEAKNALYQMGAVAFWGLSYSDFSTITMITDLPLSSIPIFWKFAYPQLTSPSGPIRYGI